MGFHALAMYRVLHVYELSNRIILNPSSASRDAKRTCVAFLFSNEPLRRLKIPSSDSSFVTSCRNFFVKICFLLLLGYSWLIQRNGIRSLYSLHSTWSEINSWWKYITNKTFYFRPIHSTVWVGLYIKAEILKLIRMNCVISEQSIWLFVEF